MKIMIVKLQVVGDYWAVAEYCCFVSTLEEAHDFVAKQSDYYDYDAVDVTGEKPVVIEQMISCDGKGWSKR